MARMDLWSLTQPVGIIRTLAVILNCMSFILAATEIYTSRYTSSSYWAWCMFTWAFCFFFTLLILILEFTTLSAKIPIAWDDFTAALAMLGSLMCLTTSIIYPTLFTCRTCYRQIGASVVSWVCFGLYAGEVALTYLRPSGQNSGFFLSLPGIMKVLETFLACVIFTSLERNHYISSPGLQWCVAVYSLCVIFSIIIIVLTIGKLTSFLPVSFDKLVTVFNILATVMYVTALVIWPLYSFPGNKRPTDCGHHCAWDKLVVVTIMTIFNFIVYTLDTVYSIHFVFIHR